MSAQTLPIEMITGILQYLTVSDRKECAVVCQSWYEASLDPMLLRDTILRVPTYTTVSLDVLIPSLERRRAQTLVLENVDLSASSTLKEASYRPLLECVHTVSCKASDISETCFVQLLSRCVNIQSLDLSCSNNLFMTGTLLTRPEHQAALRPSLAGLRVLSLCGVRHLTNAIFTQVMSLCPALDHLLMDSTVLVFHTESYLSQDTDSRAVLTFSCLLDCLRRSQVRALSLARTGITGGALDELARLPGLVLRELSLVNCRELITGSLGPLFENQRELQVLELRQCVDLRDADLALVSSHLQQLTSLDVSKCPRLSDTGIRLLHRLPKLQNLYLDSLYATDDSLTEVCAGPAARHVTRLDLNRCVEATDRTVIVLSRTMASLKHLDISSTKVSDVGLALISAHLTRLQSLRLSWCKGVSDCGLLGLVDVSPRVGDAEVALRLGDGEGKDPVITNQEHGPHTVAALSNLKQLRELDLSSCGGVTDTGLCEVLPGLPRLQSLRLAMCSPKVTDLTLMTITRYNRALELLDISHLQSCTDAGVTCITRDLRRLESLNISDCDNLTDKSIRVIQTYCHRLRYLDISMLSSVSSQAVDSLERSLRQLRHLQRRLTGTA